MKRTILSVIALLLFLTLCACSGSQSADAPSDEPSSAPSQTDASPSPDGSISEPEKKEVSYPFEDDEGRVHYQIYINGELVETDHDAYTYPDEPKGAYYPIVEILEHLGVECLFDEHLEALTTRVNGQVITCKSDNSDIVVGKTTLGGTAPEYIDGCFYVPSYTFMQLLDAVVDFTADRSGVTIKTDTVIDTANSGTAGLSISAEAVPGLGETHYTGAQACPSCGGTGRSICTSCSGTGGTSIFRCETLSPVTTPSRTTEPFAPAAAAADEPFALPAAAREADKQFVAAIITALEGKRHEQKKNSDSAYNGASNRSRFMRLQT